MKAASRRTVHRIARKVARGLDPRVRELAVALAARAADGPALLPGPPPGPVVVVAAHPDDETIGAGGALARHALAGDEVVVLVATSGEASTGSGGEAARGGVAARREEECRQACAVLGVDSPVFLRLPDGDLARHVEALAEAVREHGGRAATLYAPCVLDPHRDHRAVNVAVAEAQVAADVFGFEVWSPAPVDVVLDVTAVYERKERALRAYSSALAVVDYVRAARGLAAYRSIGGGLGGAGFAEGFVRLDAPAHAAFVRQSLA